ncbi:MAG: glycosyltransferase family 4 protein [Syntrophorhabdaceae bacterium]|nr:glycosyltransferase family 4 protein [Syntrophorhabdaceae bacterium]MDD4197104.1 glycosyltransferase family 4 protein [Syntrophorhabdaceae bacterium]
MKIGLAIYNFDPKKGGAERYTYDLAVRLAAKGHDVCVFCVNGIETKGITVVPLKTYRYPRWFRNLSFALAHRHAVRKVRPDVILGYGNVLDFDVYQSHGGVHSIWMQREIASYEKRAWRLIKKILLQYNINQIIQRKMEEHAIAAYRSKRIIAVSDMVRDHFSSHYGMDKQHIDVVYNGVDIERFRPATVSPKGPATKILFCAGNFRLKGLGPLLQAMGNVVRQGEKVHLTVMGRGKKEPFKALIDREQLGDLINFIGEHSAPEEIYRQAHIFINPTYYDSYSLTTVEAMASGLPVITTNWAGASCFVGHEEGYIIDEPDNIGALTDAIIALTDPARRKVMSENARKKAELLTIEKNADQIENILLEVFQQKERERLYNMSGSSQNK